MTKTQIAALIDSNLASASSITAAEHREVVNALLEYASSFDKILKTGTFQIGDTLIDQLFTVSFDDIGTSEYIVTGSLVSKSASFDTDNDVMWVIRNKTATSFKIALKEVSNETQNLEFDYVLIKK
jgi:hypothetical protein